VTLVIHTINRRIRMAVLFTRPAKNPCDMKDEDLKNELEYLIQIKAWGVRLEELKQEQAKRYGKEMTAHIGSPAANRYY
jgi:hypothetical protein